MKTTSILLQTLCVPCACRCRYCLLAWDGNVIGAEYERSARYAERFVAWAKEARPALSVSFAFGYSMEHPDLLRAIRFLQRIGSPGGTFLQCDGMRFRTDDELDRLFEDLKAVGMETLNFTFYGTEAYHDRFAGRTGDFSLLCRMLQSAKRHGLSVTAGMPLTAENASMAGELCDLLTDLGAESILPFVPHGEGRGSALEPIRFDFAAYERLPARVKTRLNTDLYQTEAAWVASSRCEPETRRMLLLSLTEETLECCERTPFSDVIAKLEALDERYYAAVPSFEALKARYGDPHGQKFYRRRDLFHLWQKRFLSENNLSVYDVTDERQSGSRRF